MEKEFILANVPDGTVYVAYRGSIAHGLYVPSTDPNSIDDVDVMAVYLDAPDVYLGLKEGKKSSNYFRDALDVESHELTKFLNLCLKTNPNVFSSLWVDEEHILYVDPLFKALFLNNREMFSSKKVYTTYTGYAYGQLKEMQRTDKKYEGYMGSKRKALVDEFGFDPKNAAHLIRLLTMCVEFLYSGKLIVNRRRALDEGIYLSIKKGEWPLDQVIKYAEDLREEADVRVEGSDLPDAPDFDSINAKCIDFMQQKLASKHSKVL